MLTEEQADNSLVEIEVATISDEMGAKVWAWHKLAKLLAKYKKDESKARKFIEKALFSEAKVGTNTLELPEDWELKCVRKENVTVDEAALPAALAELGKGVEDRLIKWKPSLVAAEYKKLSDEEKEIIDQALVTKPGAPTMTLIAPPEEI